MLAETGNGLARVPPRTKFVRAVETFLASPSSRLVRVDAELFRDALAMYGRTDDKSWGLVDCASFVVMGREHIEDALTTDRHFSQAGFRCLLADVSKLNTADGHLASKEGGEQRDGRGIGSHRRLCSSIVPAGAESNLGIAV